MSELPDNNIACEGSVGTGNFAQEKFEKLIVVEASAVNMALSSTDRYSRVALHGCLRLARALFILPVKRHSMHYSPCCCSSKTMLGHAHSTQCNQGYGLTAVWHEGDRESNSFCTLSIFRQYGNWYWWIFMKRKLKVSHLSLFSESSTWSTCSYLLYNQGKENQSGHLALIVPRALAKLHIKLEQLHICKVEITTLQLSQLQVRDKFVQFIEIIATLKLLSCSQENHQSIAMCIHWHYSDGTSVCESLLWNCNKTLTWLCGWTSAGLWV